MKCCQEIAYEFAYSKFKDVTDIKSAMEVSDSLIKMSPEEISEQAGNTKYVPFYFMKDVMDAVHRIIWNKFYNFFGE